MQVGWVRLDDQAAWHWPHLERTDQVMCGLPLSAAASVYQRRGSDPLMITPDRVDKDAAPTASLATDRRDTTPDTDHVARQGSAALHCGGDTAIGPGDRPVRTTRAANESSYAAAPASAAQQPSGAEPLKVKIEFVVVDGPAAEELIRIQASALKEALQWFADNSPDGGSC